MEPPDSAPTFPPQKGKVPWEQSLCKVPPRTGPPGEKYFPALPTYETLVSSNVEASFFIIIVTCEEIAS